MLDAEQTSAHTARISVKGDGMKLQIWAAAIGLAALAACNPLKRQPPPQPPLSAAALSAHVKTLASDAFEGRAPASPGEMKTIEYLTTQFRTAGLEPGAGEEYLQAVPMLETSVTNAPVLSISGPGAAQSLAFAKDWVGFSNQNASEQAWADAPLVFVGYGVTAPERGWNDYAKANIKGKIAVILINDPDYETSPGLEGPFGGKAMSYFGRWTYKLEEAARQGAAGALIIHETLPAAYPWSVVTSSWSIPQFAINDEALPRLPIQGWISGEAADAMFKRVGLNYAALKTAAQKKGFVAKPLAGLKASTNLAVSARQVISYNVAALIRGETRPNEVVIYSAHWDHLGRCPPVDGDDVCNGALDNASGTAGLIEIARAFKAGEPPQRSVLFLAVTAEEKGLLGSAYYAAHPIFAPGQTVANINMDGMPIHGTSKDIVIVGAGKNEVEDVVVRLAGLQGRRLSPDPFPERGHYYRSDQFSFAKIGVPAVFFGGGLDLTVGGVARGRALEDAFLENSYHKPSDQWSDSLDFSGATQDGQLLYDVGRELADGVAWPNWRADAEFKAARDESRP